MISVQCKTIAALATSFRWTHHPQRCRHLEILNLETVYFAVPPPSYTPVPITTKRPSPQIMTCVWLRTLYKVSHKWQTVKHNELHHLSNQKHFWVSSWDRGLFPISAGYAEACNNHYFIYLWSYFTSNLIEASIFTLSCQHPRVKNLIKSTVFNKM